MEVSQNWYKKKASTHLQLQDSWEVSECQATLLPWGFLLSSESPELCSDCTACRVQGLHLRACPELIYNRRILYKFGTPKNYIHPLRISKTVPIASTVLCIYKYVTMVALMYSYHNERIFLLKKYMVGET